MGDERKSASTGLSRVVEDEHACLEEGESEDGHQSNPFGPCVAGNMGSLENMGRRALRSLERGGTSC